MVKGTEKDASKKTSRKAGLGEAGGTPPHYTEEAVKTDASDRMTPADPGALETSGDSEMITVAAAYEEPADALRDNLPAQEVQQPGGPVYIISADKFKEQINGLRLRSTIKNDRGEEIAFEGATKEEFIRFCEEGYPVVEKMMEAVYETGRFLSEVRKALKPKRLFLSWMNFTGLQERRSYRYLKVYERFGDRLPDFTHLGIRKLLAASHLKDCVEYLDAHKEDAENQTAGQFEQTIRNRMAGKKKGRSGRKPSYVDIAGCKVRRSEDGSRLVIEGLSKKSQEKLFDAIKALLLEENSET